MVIAAMLVAMGCGHPAETDTTAVPATSTTTATAPTGTTVQGPPTILGSSTTAGTPSGISKVLPDDFPLDVPIYPNGVVTEATKTSADTGVTYRVIVQSNDDGITILDWYKTALPNAGWTVTMSLANGTNSRMNAAKRTVSLTIAMANGTDGEHKTLVSVIVMTTQ